MIPAIAIPLSLMYGFIILRSEVMHDYRHWKVDDYHEIKHGKRWRLRALMMIPAIVGLLIGLQPEGNELLFTPLICAGWGAVAFWLLFDGWFNNKRDFNWWHVGSDDPADAHTDDVIQKLRKWQHIAVKVGLTALFTFFYLYFLLR